MRMNRRQFAAGFACAAALAAFTHPAWAVDTVRIVHAFSGQSPVHSRLQDLVPRMEEAADFSARFEVYSASELGAWDDLMFGTFEGRYDFVLGPASLFAAHHKSVGVLARSDLFWSSGQWTKFKGSSAEGAVASLFEEIDLELIGSAWLASEHIVTSKVIHSMQDLKGIKIRVSGQQTAYVEALEAMGARPVDVHWSDVYTALQQGTIDASVQPIAWMDMKGLYKLSKTIVRNPVGGHVGWLVGRRDWRSDMDSITAELVQMAVSEAMVNLSTEMLSFEKATLDMSAHVGLDVAEFDEVDMEVFYDAIRDAWQHNLNGEDREIAELIGGP